MTHDEGRRRFAAELDNFCNENALELCWMNELVLQMKPCVDGNCAAIWIAFENGFWELYTGQPSASHDWAANKILGKLKNYRETLYSLGPNESFLLNANIRPDCSKE